MRTPQQGDETTAAAVATAADQPEPPREISVDEAMGIAIDCMKEGRLRDAGSLCRAVLALEPDHPDALHYSGMLAHAVGERDEAIRLIRRSLELAPQQPDWHSNLGIVLQARGDLGEAMDAFRQAIALDPGHENAFNNLGVLLRVCGRLDEAEACYRRVIELNANHLDAHLNLAVVLDQTGRAQDALTTYCRAITLRPSHPEARRLLALAYAQIGEPEKAVQVCQEWLERNPDDPRAQHALAAYSGRDVPPRASDAYVQKVFDDFAEGFEAKLARLHYRAPALVGDALAAAVPVADGTLDILDAGCGTGLCGPLLAPYARRLVGVDLSAGMLEYAREKSVYHELQQAELTAYLQQQDRAFDAIVTADTLVYFGALEDAIAASASALRPGGVLIFTVEEAMPPGTSDSYALQPHGRYVHGVRYVERLLAQNGFEFVIGRGDLRLESGLPVPGLVVRAVKAARTAAAGSHADSGERHG